LSKCGSRILKEQKLPSIRNNGGRNPVVQLLANTENPEVEKIGNRLKRLSKKPSVCSLITKFARLLTADAGSPWELMNWVKKRRLPATEAIKFNGSPCLSLESLWNALHKSFNNALHHQIDINILNKIENKPGQPWSPFSSHEFKSALIKCSDSSAPGPNKMSWCHWKLIFSNDDCLSKVINIADACINLGYWPDYFKISMTIVIPKPNKQSYDNPKAF